MFSIHALIFNEHLLSTYMPGTIQGAGGAAVNQKASAHPCGAAVLILKCMYRPLGILAPKEGIPQLI